MTEGRGPGIEGLDVEALYASLSAALGSPGQWGIDRARGGLFGETLWLTWGRRRFVVRRPTDATPDAPGDRAREYRVADALWRTEVPVPRTVDALATVHAVDPGATGLDDLPAPTPTERAERLRRRLAALLDRRAGDPPRAAERVGDWLTGTAPDPLASDRRRLVQGEFGLDNVAFARSPPPTVAAVLDWERCRLGDPQSDLARAVVCRELAGPDGDRTPCATTASRRCTNWPSTARGSACGPPTGRATGRGSPTRPTRPSNRYSTVPDGSQRAKPPDSVYSHCVPVIARTVLAITGNCRE